MLFVNCAYDSCGPPAFLGLVDVLGSPMPSVDHGKHHGARTLRAAVQKLIESGEAPRLNTQTLHVTRTMKR